MQDTQPFFIVSSGRSGTHALAKALNIFPEVDCKHEYLVHYMQPLAFEYYHRLVSESEVIETIRGTYGSTVALSDKPLWGDSSNKASWLIRPLLKVFPNAKFIWLVRDGRKVVSSYYNKLADEMYDDKSVKIMRRWLENPDNNVQPPPEKKYWWPLPASCYQEDPLDRFGLVAWHWEEVNRAIGTQLRWVKQDNTFVVKLEDLVSNNAPDLENLLNFLGLPLRDDVRNTLRVPDNVFTPQDFPLTSEQQKIFWKECRPTMELFDYSEDFEYITEYHPEGWDK